MFDSHCHLDFADFDADREAVWEAARQAGVEGVLVPAFAPDGWARVARVVAAIPGAHAALGVHPWALSELGPVELEGALSNLGEQAVQLGAVAIGECGLDARLAKRGGPGLDVQQRVLEAQLDVAAELQLPVVLHAVSAHGRLLELLEQRGPLAQGGVLHSYSGSAELVPRYAALGLYFSFAGSLTRPSARKPVEAARAVPGERLLIESDGPDQAPTGAASRRSQPAYLPLVCRALAAARAEPLEALAQYTADNARRLFRL